MYLKSNENIIPKITIPKITILHIKKILIFFVNIFLL